MIRPITALTALLACGAGLYLYQSKHRAHLLDQQIETTVHQADTVRERIRMLHAEWTLLNRPDRLQRLADQFLSLEPTKPGQFVAEADLASRLPPVQIPAATPPAPDGAPGLTAPDTTEPGTGVPVAAVTPPAIEGASTGASTGASMGTSTGASEGAATASAPAARQAEVAATALPPQKRPQPVRLAATRPVPAHRMDAARQDPPPPGAAAWRQRHVAEAVPPAPRPWSAPPARYQAARAPVAAYQPPRYLPAGYRPPTDQPPAYQPPAYRPPAYRPPGYHPPAYHPPAYHPSVYGAAYRAPAPLPAGSLLGMAQGSGAAPPPPAPMPVMGSSGG